MLLAPLPPALLLEVGAVDGFRGSENWTVTDWVKCGSISFALTVVNICCIWVSGICMFRLKEVAPVKTKNTFWTRDLKTARDANREQKVWKGADAKVLQDGLKVALKVRHDTRGRITKN